MVRICLYLVYTGMPLTHFFFFIFSLFRLTSTAQIYDYQTWLSEPCSKSSVSNWEKFSIIFSNIPKGNPTQLILLHYFLFRSRVGVPDRGDTHQFPRLYEQVLHGRRDLRVSRDGRQIGGLLGMSRRTHVRGLSVFFPQDLSAEWSLFL